MKININIITFNWKEWAQRNMMTIYKFIYKFHYEVYLLYSHYQQTARFLLTPVKKNAFLKKIITNS